MLPRERWALTLAAACNRRIKSGLDSFQDTMRQTSAADVARAQSTLDSLGIGSPRGRRQTADDAMVRSGSRSRMGGLAGPSMRRVQSSVDVRRPNAGPDGSRSSISNKERSLSKSGTQGSLAEQPVKDWDILQAFSSSFHEAMAPPHRPLFPSLTAPSLSDVRPAHCIGECLEGCKLQSGRTMCSAAHTASHVLGSPCPAGLEARGL